MWLRLWLNSVIAILCVNSIALAQPTLSIQNYTPQNSPLPYTNVQALAYDSVNHTIWVGTTLGLAAFDGSNWQIWNETPDVRALALDTLGRIWVGMFNNGIGVKDGDNWQFYTTSNSPLLGNYVKSIAIDSQQRAWIGTAGGLSVLSPNGDWQNYYSVSSELLLTIVNDIAIDRDQRAWVCPINGGFLTWLDTFFYTYTVANSNAPDNTFLAVDVDAANNKWLATAADGLVRFNTQPPYWTVFNTATANLPTNSLSDVAVWRDNAIIAATQGNGLAIIQPNAPLNTLVFTPDNSSVPDTYINCLTVQNDSIFWAGTANNGLIRCQITYANSTQTPLSTTTPLAYPNPTSSQIYTSLSSAHLQLFDLYGKTVAQATQTNHLDVTELPNGVYYLKIVFQDGIHKQKIVVLH